MNATTIAPGGLVVKDPIAEKVYVFDWDTDYLGAGVGIAQSTFSITAIRPTSDTALTKDQEGFVTGSSTRKTTLRLKAGTLGGLYEITNKIVTNETPAQTDERSFRVLIQNR